MEGAEGVEVEVRENLKGHMFGFPSVRDPDVVTGGIFRRKVGGKKGSWRGDIEVLGESWVQGL